MSDDRASVVPRARTEDLIVRRLADETLVYDERTDRMHCLNRSAALVWDGCDGTRSVADLANIVGAEFGDAVALDLVWHALACLKNDDLLAEPLATAGEGAMSRRRLMKMAGVGILAAIPAISSIAVPTAAQAGSCLGTGASCAAGAQCCSGVCSTSVCQ